MIPDRLFGQFDAVLLSFMVSIVATFGQRFDMVESENLKHQVVRIRAVQCLYCILRLSCLNQLGLLSS